MSRKILIVEDESIVALDLQSRLTAQGFSVVGIAKSGERAIEQVVAASPDIVLMDVQLTGSLDGIETAARLQEVHPVPVIFLTAFSDQKNIQRAKKSAAYGYLLKPYQERELVIAIELALYKFSAEQQLRTNRLLLDTTLNGIHEGVLTSDADGHVVFMNTAAEAITGIVASDAHGRSLSEIVVVEEIDVEEESSPATWQNLSRPDGSQVPVEVQTHRLDTSTEEAVMITVLRDISELRRYQHSLIEAKNAAEAAAHAKSAFISKMSHELRTPLNGILGMAQLILEEDLSDPLSGYLEVLTRSAEKLLQLVNDILVTAQTGSDALQPELFSPKNLVETIVRSHAFEANRRGLRLVLRIDPALPGGISADPRVVGRILEKLMSNALKFTRMGHVEVALHLLERGKRAEKGERDVYRILRCATGVSDPRIQLIVSDTGIGIPQDKIDEVFREYYQIDERVNRTAEGVGLGLPIVARLAEQLGAGLSITSLYGKGSSFAVEIPVPDEREKGATVERPAPQKTTAPVVVYTDDPLLARSIEPHVRYHGATLNIVAVPEVVAALESIDEEQSIRVVLSTAGYEKLTGDPDLEMPAGAAPIILVDSFSDHSENRRLTNRRVIRYKEPLTAETIRSIVVGTWAAEYEQQAPVERQKTSLVSDRVLEIVQGGDAEEISRQIRDLRSTTTDLDLQELLFRLSVAFQRSDSEKLERILEQLTRYETSTRGGNTECTY